MAYQAYSNFKNGLDTRRSELTTQPGSLVEIQDAHVNEGAEAEQRRAFLNASYVPLRTFGLEVTSSGPIVFTDGYDVVATVSRAETSTTATLVLAEPFLGGIGDNIIVTGLGNTDYNGSWVVATVSGTTVTFLNNSGNTELTTGDTGGTVSFNAWYNSITYQTLQHPAVYFGATYNATYHKMTGVTASTSFGGEAWVSATFADGKTYVYYNGIPVPAWYNGTALSGWTVGANQQKALAMLLKDSLYSLNTSTATNWFTDWASNATSFNVWSSVGLNYSLVIANQAGTVTTNGNVQTATNASDSSTLTVTQLYNGVPSSSGVSATAIFYIQGATSGSTMTNVYITDASGKHDILGGTVTFDGSTITTWQQFATAVATQISTYISNPQYTAVCNSTTGQITISQVVPTTTPAGGYVVETVATGAVIVDNNLITFSSASSGSTYCSQITANSVTLMVTHQEFTGDYGTWAQAIVTEVNSHATGYCAWSPTLAGTGAASAVIYISVLTRNSNDNLAGVTFSASTTGSAPTIAYTNNALVSTATFTAILNVPSSQNLTVKNNNGTSQLESLTITGGTAPYSYVWSIASFTSTTLLNGQPAVTATIGSPNNSTTTVNFTSLTKPASATAVISCKITDSTTPTALVTYSPSISINFTN